MAYVEFYKKLKKYQPYEKIAAEKIANIYNVKIVSYNNDYRYDFIMSDNNKYELKCDVMSIKTGNFFIEIQAYGKLSGLLITEADYYIISNTIDYYLIETNKLKEIIEKNNCSVLSTKNNLTTGHILKKILLIENSIKI
jgi:hypothetical protein